jgi:hypothetical protein
MSAIFVGRLEQQRPFHQSDGVIWPVFMHSVAVYFLYSQYHLDVLHYSHLWLLNTYILQKLTLPIFFSVLRGAILCMWHLYDSEYLYTQKFRSSSIHLSPSDFCIALPTYSKISHFVSRSSSHVSLLMFCKQIVEILSVIVADFRAEVSTITVSVMSCVLLSVEFI